MSAPTRRQFTLASLAAAGLASPAARAAAQASAPSGWSSAPGLPIRVQEIYPAVLDGRIYLAGGLSPDTGTEGIGISSRVFSWAPGEPGWRELASLPLPLHHPVLAPRGDRLLAVGGFTAADGGGWAMQEAVHAYDPASDSWQDGPSMPQPLGETVGAVHQGAIHLVTGRRPSGGANANWPDHSDINAHIVLDGDAQEWRAAPPAPTARNSAAGVLLDGRLHVIGGRTVTGGNTPVHEAFDIAAGRWGTLAPLPEPAQGPRGAGGLAAAALNGTIYVFGGEWFGNGGGVYSQVWAYDAEEDGWREASRMPTPRHGLGAVTLGDAIYTIAGAARAGGNETSAAVEVFRP